MYLGTKSYLKSNRNHTVKLTRSNKLPTLYLSSDALPELK